MIIGPKYKIARRLGAAIFDKTQTQKFAMREARKVKAKFTKPKSDYGKQMLEKQKARFTYGVNERQFAKYVKSATASKGLKPVESLFEKLEMRLDNIVYRMSFAPTRQAARQMVSHGHILVNGNRATIPSMKISTGDKISIRIGSAKKALFANLDERLKTMKTPNWIKLDFDKKTAEIQGVPKLENSEANFDLSAVMEFYSR